MNHTIKVSGYTIIQIVESVCAHVFFCKFLEISEHPLTDSVSLSTGLHCSVDTLGSSKKLKFKSQSEKLQFKILLLS